MSTPPRQAPHLRAAIAKSNWSYAMRLQGNWAIEAYETGTGRPADLTMPQLQFDNLVALAELCCRPDAAADNLLGADWALGTVERMLRKNPTL